MNLSDEQKRGGGIELGKKKSSRRELLDPDNPTPEMMYHCKTYYRKVLNPIVDWTTDEVWEFIKEYNVRYCCLYDQGYTRLGCIGCPMATKREREREFAKYPKYQQNYIKAFQRMIDTYKEKSGHGYRMEWESGEEVFDWWLNEDRNRNAKMQAGQEEINEE